MPSVNSSVLLHSNNFDTCINKFVIMAGRIHRVILFKVPDPEQQKLIVDRYKKVFAEATKVCRSAVE